MRLGQQKGQKSVQHTHTNTSITTNLHYSKSTVLASQLIHAAKAKRSWLYKITYKSIYNLQACASLLKCCCCDCYCDAILCSMLNLNSVCVVHHFVLFHLYFKAFHLFVIKFT